MSFFPKGKSDSHQDVDQPVLVDLDQPVQGLQDDREGEVLSVSGQAEILPTQQEVDCSIYTEVLRMPIWPEA